MKSFFSNGWRSALLPVFCLAGSLTLLTAALVPPARATSAEEGPKVTATRAIQIEARAVIPQETPIGRMRLLAALELSADDLAFGGYSGMELAPDASRMIAVSDHGSWLSVPLVHDATGRLTSVGDGHVGPLLDPAGQPIAGRMMRDAEELIDLGESWLVSFEGRHRLWRYPGDDGVHGMAGVTGVPRFHPHPRAIHQADENGGMEALAQLANGHLLLISESFLDRRGRIRGWIGGLETRWKRISLQHSEPFAPTSLAPLPGGDVLLVERSYSRADGVRVRLSRLRAETIVPGAHLVGEELARMDPQHPVDNFEASASRVGPQGKTLVYLLSDDNFSPRQRTLLLQLAIDDP